MEPFIQFIVRSPIVSILLLTVSFLGLALDIRKPGRKFMLKLTAPAMVIFFALHYLGGLVEYWELLLVVLGIFFLLIEFVVIPGFGFAGILGILLTAGGMLASLLGNKGLDFSSTGMSNLLVALAQVLGSMIVASVAGFWLARYLVDSENGNPMIDTDKQDKKDGYTAHDPSHDKFIGKEFLTVTDLRPVGTIEGEGVRLVGISEEGFIEKGRRVKVIGVQEVDLIVRKVPDIPDVHESNEPEFAV